MGDVKNLLQTDAIKKLKELAEDIGICMFCTDLGRVPFQTRPMETLKVDEDGDIWFLSAASSDKNDEIRHNSDVQLIYAKNPDAHFLSVSGKASVSRDKAKIEELWTKKAAAWFKEGKQDPNLTVVCVKPVEAYYWDTKNGKMIALLKNVISAVSGLKIDSSVEGKMRL